MAGHPFEDLKFDVAVQETWYEVVIRYGLYLGAVFQMACIMVVCFAILRYTGHKPCFNYHFFQAVILLPDKESPEGGEDNRFGFEILKSSNYTQKKIFKR